MKSINKLIYVSLLTLFLITSCKLAENIFCYEYNDRPEVALTYKEIVSMLSQYDATKRDALPLINGEYDTRINHFKIEDLKDYLAYVEKLSKDKKIKITGINIIAAAYPENHPDSIKRNHQTLIFIPTTTINGKKGVSFDPLHSEAGKPKPFTEILEQYGYDLTLTKDDRKKGSQKMKKGVQSNKSDSDELSSAANRLGISPPLNNY